MTIIGSIRGDQTDELNELRKQQLLRIAASLPEIPRRELEFGPYGRITHRDTTYHLVRGEIQDARYSPAVAHYIAADGTPRFLEPAA
jgi:hypothetical protein